MPTVKKNLRAFLARNPTYVDRLDSFCLRRGVPIDRVEQDAGPVCLWRANLTCKSLVDRVVRPMHAQYLREKISASANGQALLEIENLIDFLYEDYTQFVRDTNNGVTSTAGRVARALVNSDLAEGTHFITTGPNSNADLVVLQTDGARRRLSIETRSYNARALATRAEGCTAIGFYRDATEFGSQRTLTLGVSPLAIYMPMDTFANPDRAGRVHRSQR